MYVEPTIKRIPESDEDINEIKKIIDGNDMVKNVVVADDYRSTAIIATLDKTANEDSVFAAINQILVEFPGTEKIHYGGLPYLRQAIGKDVKRDGLILIKFMKNPP